MLDAQVAPWVEQASEPLVGGDLLANLRHPFLANGFRSALHMARIADLPVGPGAGLGIPILASQGARTHRADLLLRCLDALDPPLDLLKSLLPHAASFLLVF